MKTREMGAIVGIGVVAASVFAGDVVVHLRNGQKVSYPSEQVEKITFDEGWVTHRRPPMLGEVPARRLRNVALSAHGVIATASSQGAYADYTADPMQAIDGKIGSWHEVEYSHDDPPKSHRENFWAPTRIPAWLQLEFPREQRIEEIIIYFSQHALTMGIQGSLDGANWFEVVPQQRVNVKRPGDAPASRHTRQGFPVPPNTRVKYLKFNITSTDAPGSHIYQADLDEIIVLGE